MPLTHPIWADWSDEDILSLRFRDLRLPDPEIALAEPLAQLRRELAARGLRVRLHFWFSNEWFVPDGVSGIALPFYLAHPRLARLERRLMRDAEGVSPNECLRILRHEAGHAIENAYGLRGKPDVEAVFGSSDLAYPSRYTPRPHSRRFVRHLGHGYAQSHPDEDFAETFAVWLGPKSGPRGWRTRYRDWPALAKLEAMDEWMRRLVDKRPLPTGRRRVEPAASLDLRLRAHYARRRKAHGLEPGASYDRALRRLFPARGSARSKMTADRFLRKMEKTVCREAAHGRPSLSERPPQYVISRVVQRMAGRARELELRVGTGDERVIASLVARQALRFLRTDAHPVTL